MLRASITIFGFFIIAANSALGGLANLNWVATENYIQVIGRSKITSSTKFCSRISGKLECELVEPKPDYYLLECDRNRGICDGVRIVTFGSEPRPVKVEYRISEWSYKRVSATLYDPHPCMVTTLQIDLDSKEVVFTETYTKIVKNDSFSVPENVGLRKGSAPITTNPAPISRKRMSILA
jgi:hypothetical protein